MIGLAYFKTAEFQFRLFAFFLVAGFCTDITMYSLQNTTSYKYLPDILNVYSLMEASTFLWLVHHNSKQKLTLRVSQLLLIATPLFWIMVVFFKPISIKVSASQLFDPYYEVSVAFLASFILLEMVERSNAVTTLPIFWLFLGIFFYCFSTFFLMEFLNTIFSQRIWVLSNIINIITYIFYSVGLWKIQVRRI